MDEVRRIRKDHGLSQQRLSELAGVDKVTIVHIEGGKVSPKVETLEKLARALDVEVGDFFPKVEPSLFPPEIASPEQERLIPSSADFQAISAINDYCNRLEEIVSRPDLDPTIATIHGYIILLVGKVISALWDKVEIQQALRPVVARYVKLARRLVEKAEQSGVEITANTSEVVDATERFARAS